MTIIGANAGKSRSTWGRFSPFQHFYFIKLVSQLTRDLYFRIARLGFDNSKAVFLLAGWIGNQIFKPIYGFLRSLRIARVCEPKVPAWGQCCPAPALRDDASLR